MARPTAAIDGEVLRRRPATPAVSVVVPVNAQGDLDTVRPLLRDLASYGGPHPLELILVVNNYPPQDPPPQIAAFRQSGIKVVAIPSVYREGFAPALRARMHGLAAAESEAVICFDADCRIPSPTTLVDWYVDQLRDGADVAYTHVGHHDLPDELAVRVRIGIHHLARWIKRVVLRIPTTRGSNYGVARSRVLHLYEQGYIADEMHVGPAVKAAGGRVTYSGARDLVVLTSGRRIGGGWRRIGRYVTSRLRYNVRALPVRRDAARHTGRRDVPRAAPGGGSGQDQGEGTGRP